MGGGGVGSGGRVGGVRVDVNEEFKGGGGSGWGVQGGCDRRIEVFWKIHKKKSGGGGGGGVGLGGGGSGLGVRVDVNEELKFCEN